MESALGGYALGTVIYADDAVLLLFGDDQAGMSTAREAAARAGCRVGAECAIADATDRLDAQADLQAIMLVAQEPTAELERLLIRVEEASRTRYVPAIIIAPPAMIDVVATAGLRPGIRVLIDPPAAEVQAELAAILAPAPARVAEANGGSAVALLQQLSDEAARIAAALAALSTDPAGLPRPVAIARGEDGAGLEDANFVRAIIRMRRMRDQYFRGEIFADPAYDMLLDLYAARLEGVRVAVSSLCIASAVPATTALRWIKALTDRGLFVRRADPQDGRRIYIEMSDDAARAMGAYLVAVQRAALTAI